MRKFAALLVLLFLATLGAVAQSSVGDVWYSPTSVNPQPGATFTTDMLVNTGTLKLAAYTFEMTFTNIIAVNTAVGTQGVTAGPDGFVTVVNPQPTMLTISSFDVTGKAASTSLRLLTINWNAVSNGTTTITNTVKALSNEATTTIGTPRAANSVSVQVGTVTTPTPPTQPPTPTRVVITPTRVVTTPTPTRVVTVTPTRVVTVTPTRVVTVTPTRVVTVTPTRVVVSQGPHPVGEVWFVEPSINLPAAGGFTTSVAVNSGTQKLAAYTFEMTFGANISVNRNSGTDGVTAGPDGFVTVVNPQATMLTISSFDVAGKGPGTNLQLLSIAWNGTPGTTTIANNVKALSDETTATIGTPVGKSIQVVIQGTPNSPTPTPPVITPTPPVVTPTPPSGCTAGSLPLNIDGTGSQCRTLTSITNYVNSWETTSVTINGQDFTNRWAAAASLPAKVNGVYTIQYVGKATWSHFEAR